MAFVLYYLRLPAENGIYLYTAISRSLALFHPLFGLSSLASKSPSRIVSIGVRISVHDCQYWRRLDLPWLLSSA
jgi:hypothetical protein